MKFGVVKESQELEARVALTPQSAQQIRKLGHECLIQSGAGDRADFADDVYREAGVEVVDSADAVFEQADVIAKVRPPTEAEVEKLREGQTLISFFYPAENEALMKKAAEKGATLMAVDMVPRISRAQKLDALSSMANIAGYRAVIEAANNFGRFMTGQVTAAGKVPPAKVLVVGTGVAGLAAIGAATSLGAIVKAFDVRPETAEQVESMGAEFLFLDFEDSSDGSGEGGYAKPSSPEFRDKQLALFREQAPEIDIVITTALIPNREAPELWTEDMVQAMKPGSVIVDLAAEKGGNCKMTRKDEKFVTDNGVTIIGYTDFPSRMAKQSSTLYATNIRHMLTDLTPEKDGKIEHDMEDRVIRDSTITHGGEVTWPPPKRDDPSPKASQKKTEKPKQKTAEEKRAEEMAAFRRETRQQVTLLAVGAVVMLAIGIVAPPSLMSHLIVFALACFVGFQVIWGVSHSLHTPLMAVTNAVSGIIILGALLQIGAHNWLVVILSFLAIGIASINIVGGFLVTRRMLSMFVKS